MANPLIGLHAFLGEFGVIAFLWVFVELLSPTEARLKRAKIASMIGVFLLFASWLVGGYYYVNVYGSEVKPLIKAGPEPWAHAIFTETKEHVFMFLPFLGVLILGLVSVYGNRLLQDTKARNAVLLLAIVVVVIGFSMAGMGYLISSGARAALEAGATP
ncbi:MAG: hypothetical protein QT03_C0001G0806 [archaeon GW2011_AR10]|uniref:Uncharacterized protein n=1 Tax=Candidatus Iainarchaeum sp. TaxID=3101447 RepID=A0A7J4J0B5_9ARCH|nr:MAG: hypothetical protein QT03_C0001G0806 [archaeon GW2011_AR10]HIH08666.1 hypothetical protein [Candidatus Diapherotrites archaeon]